MEIKISRELRCLMRLLCRTCQVWASLVPLPGILTAPGPAVLCWISSKLHNSLDVNSVSSQLNAIVSCARHYFLLLSRSHCHLSTFKRCYLSLNPWDFHCCPSHVWTILLTQILQTLNIWINQSSCSCPSLDVCFDLAKCFVNWMSSPLLSVCSNWCNDS